MYRSCSLLSMVMVVVLASFTANAAENPYIVIDADTGSILSENQPHHRWHPASLTKLMTAYVTFRALKNAEIEDGSPVVISRAATRQPPSKMGYKQGVQLRIDTALKIIIIKSANDVSLALAEAVAGSLRGFVSRMNAEAKRLGMNNTRFENSNGLHNKKQYSSPRDMALLSAQIIKEFPQYTYMFEAVGIKTPVKTHLTYNLLLERYPGTTGMKTGFVCASGYNMVASAKREGRNLIAVVMGRSSQTDRAVSAARLLTVAANKIGSSSIYSQAPTGKPPKNMRPILCTQEARANRYDPAAGAAVIQSPFLSSRKRSTNILPIKSGGVDGSPSDAWVSRKLAFNGKAPIPTKRPNFDPRLGRIVLQAIGTPETGSVAIPLARPR